MFDLIMEPLAVLAAADSTTPSAWWRFFGRLHPLLLHFPIAMLVAAACVELVLCWRKDAQPSVIASFCLWVGTVSAILATWTGWEMAEFEGIAANPVKAELLEWHRWTGVVLAILSILLCLFWLINRLSSRRWPFHVYRYGLWAAGVLVCVVGHFGAEMKWGRDYLFSVLRAPAAASEIAPETPASDQGKDESDSDTEESKDTASNSDTPSAALISWNDQIEPLFAAQCADCHGPQKQKGGLQLVPYEAFESHLAVIDQAEPLNSLLVHRIVLPEDDPDAMPPGGPAMSKEEVEVIQNWIGQGAPGPVAATTADQSSASTASSPAASGPRRTDPASVKPSPFDSAKQLAAMKTIDGMGGHVAPISEGSPWLDVNLSLMRPPATDEQIRILSGIRETVIWLNLGATAITDSGLKTTVSGLTTLHRLRLDRTGIGDAGLAHLESLQALEVLNLFGTQVTDAGLVSIERLSSLRVVYLWDSAVTSDGVKALQAARPELEIIGAPEPPVSVGQDNATATGSSDSGE